MRHYYFTARVMLDSALDMIDRDEPPISGSVYADSLAEAATIAQAQTDANWVNTLVVDIRVGDNL